MEPAAGARHKHFPADKGRARTALSATWDGKARSVGCGAEVCEGLVDVDLQQLRPAPDIAKNGMCMSASSSAECGRGLCCEAAAACCSLEAAGGCGQTPVFAAPLQLQAARGSGNQPRPQTATENATTARTRATRTMPVTRCMFLLGICGCAGLRHDGRLRLRDVAAVADEEREIEELQRSSAAVEGREITGQKRQNVIAGIMGGVGQEKEGCDVSAAAACARLTWRTWCTCSPAAACAQRQRPQCRP
jgi:hypothetical protein